MRLRPQIDASAATNHKAGFLTVRNQPIAQLKQNPKNPRTHSRQQIRQIARSIDAHGFNVPILVDRNLKIIAGHGRMRAAEMLGWTEVPTICLDQLDDVQAMAFAIADNRLTENSAWDDTILAEQLKELSALDLSFSLEATGFEMGEIDLRIANLKEKTRDTADTADAIPASSPDSAVSRLGDLWLMDGHRVYCGSALEPETLALLMDSKRAAMVFADPPYNVQIEGHASGLGAIHHREFAMACGEMDSSAFVEFLFKWITLATQHCIDGSIHFICMDWRHSAELVAAGNKVFSELKNICVWVKHNAGMGSLYRSQHEFVHVFKYGRGPHRNNVQLGQYGRYRSNVWNYPGAASFGRPNEEGNLLALHPTVKPVALVADAILDCSSRGDLILDPFLGSGTTILAAERTGRRCYGLEIDPLYVDVVIRRWQNFTGNKARHAESGRLFNDCEAAFGPSDGC